MIIIMTITGNYIAPLYYQMQYVKPVVCISNISSELKIIVPKIDLAFSSSTYKSEEVVIFIAIYGSWDFP